MPLRTTCIFLIGLTCALAAAEDPAMDTHPPIPIRFHLDRPGHVTLVIEDQDGKRVRNLIAATPFPAGDNLVWWDGQDESVRVDYVERNVVGLHGIYEASGRLVAPGEYRVRGLVRDALDLRYEFTVYPNTENPPWRTSHDKGGAGGWLADHTPPSDLVFVPAASSGFSEDRIYISAMVAEAGYGLIWTDLDGRKLDGERWIGGNWTGASHLARDTGPAAHANITLITGSGFRDDRDREQGQIRINALTPQGVRNVLTHSVAASHVEHNDKGKVTASLHGLALHNGLAVAAVGGADELLFIRIADPAKKKATATLGSLIGRAKLGAVRALNVDQDGHLLVLFKKEIRRYRLPAKIAGNVKLGSGEVLVDRGLEDAQRLSVGPDGRLYVSDWGNSHQVKSFAADGTPGQRFGEPGKPAVGPYHPGKMQHPLGCSVLPDGRLWVAENDFAPKRVSIWASDGALLKDLIGPPKYGGGGTLDPHDPSRFLYTEGSGANGGGIEFRLNWDDGSAKVVQTYLRTADHDFKIRCGPASPDPSLPIRYRGREYLTNAYSVNATGGARVCTIWRMVDGVAIPAALLGSVAGFTEERRQELKPMLQAAGLAAADPRAVLVLWSDPSGAGQLHDEQLSFHHFDGSGTLYSITVGDQLDLHVVFEHRVLTLPATLDGQDIPHYDLDTATVAIDGLAITSTTGGGELVLGEGGWQVVTAGPIVGFRNGQRQWYYHNQWPGLHAGHRGPAQPQHPGQLIAVTRLLGRPFAAPGPEREIELFAVNSDRAVMYLMTTDGLFVDQLGVADPAVQWRDPKRERGMLLNEVNFVGEHFWPTITRYDDGRVFMVAGKEHSSLIRIDGLDSLRRLPEHSLSVSREHLLAAEAWQRAQTAPDDGPATLAVRLRSDSISTDGKLDEWANAQWVTVATNKTTLGGWGSLRQVDEEYVSAALAVSGDRLHLALRSKFPDVLDNAQADPLTMFKTGGAIDIMIGSDPQAKPDRQRPVAGDQRLLISRVGEQVQAALYRPVVPGTAKPIPFSSPWRTVTIDRIDDLSSDVKLGLNTVSEEDEAKRAIRVLQIEISIPLARLGLKPTDGQILRGDIGVLRGSGGETIQRLYWRNKATGLISDVPGEVQLSPGLWGNLRFER